MRKGTVTVGNIQAEIWWKKVKRMTIVVYHGSGRVRISVPPSVNVSHIRQVLAAKLHWIIEQRAKVNNSSLSQVPLYLSGELHSFKGNDYRLQVIEGSRRNFVQFDPDVGIALHIRSGSSVEQRERVLLQWYRAQLNSAAADILPVWQRRVGKDVLELRIKRMKTRWGTCNIKARRIWLNLELIKKPLQCLEYILVHEMVHLLEKGHNTVFYSHMDRLLPDWRSRDCLLKMEKSEK